MLQLNQSLPGRGQAAPRCDCDRCVRSMRRVLVTLVLVLITCVVLLLFSIRALVYFPAITTDHGPLPAAGATWLAKAWSAWPGTSDGSDRASLDCADALTDGLVRSGHWPRVVSIACTPERPTDQSGVERRPLAVMVVCWRDADDRLRVTVAYRRFTQDDDGDTAWRWVDPIDSSDVPAWAPRYMREIPRARLIHAFTGLRRSGS